MNSRPDNTSAVLVRPGEALASLLNFTGSIFSTVWCSPQFLELKPRGCFRGYGVAKFAEASTIV